MSSIQIDELHRKVGRNLLRIQAMEFALNLVGRKTFGICVPSGFFEQSSQFIDQARNDLILHFGELAGMDLLKPQGLERASVWLDEQFEKSNEQYHYLRVHSLLVLLVLVEGGSASASEYGFCHQKLLEQLPPGFEYIDEDDDTGSAWATSRIVGLLRQARVHGVD
jgi:hypothetical protein